MSNIPKARTILQTLLDAYPRTPHKKRLRLALRLMLRRPPTFRAAIKYKKLNPKERKVARSLRRMGMAIDTIAKQLNNNPGRVSDAVRGVHKEFSR
jgi:DNA-binding NarL/FixJ family response regulator